MLLVRFTQLQQLSYLGLSMVFFVNFGLYTALRTRALRDVDISEARLLRNMLASVDKVSGPTPLPILDTLRIRNSAAHWRNLMKFLDLKHMKRLGVWDYEQEIGDLTNEWGGLVTVSAHSLEMLSLWLTSNIIDKDIPKYLQSISGFPYLHTLALFLDIHHVDSVPTLLWMDIFPLIIRAFHTCSPSLRHIRLHPHNWNATYTYDELLKDQHFAQFAHEVAGLKNLETIELYFRSSQPPPANDHDAKLVRLAGMFHPVHLLIQYGVPWNLAWPFFADDRQDAEWTKILTRS
ncbi:hypothetical protein DL96DRAFT_126863 [Flagelloscypha sp. PMI_526]|nr:hypothetical protein DL96DRAFT_126863 [Flagelloscypha sp. PMI_526]